MGNNSFKIKGANISGETVTLPGNRKFGIFFCFMFFLLGIYLGINVGVYESIAAVAFSVILLLFSLIKPDILLPFNIMWMRLGLTLGKIFNPVVLGIIFFILISPVALFFKVVGRDHLCLKKPLGRSYWIPRRGVFKSESFKSQF